MMIFLDSSILIEYIKGNQTELLDAMTETTQTLCINHIVYSEFMFHFLAIMSGKAPLTLKGSLQTQTVLETHKPLEFFEQFQTLEMNQQILRDSHDFMRTYHLLPNDALIFATCRHYEIPALASYDSDFKEICKTEDITLLTSIEDLQTIAQTEHTAEETESA